MTGPDAIRSHASSAAIALTLRRPEILIEPIEALADRVTTAPSVLMRSFCLGPMRFVRSLLDGRRRPSVRSRNLRSRKLRRKQRVTWRRLWGMTTSKLSASDVLSVSPISLVCPLCKARPKRDCSTSSGGFSLLHIARIRAAAAKNANNGQKTARKHVT